MHSARLSDPAYSCHNDRNYPFAGGVGEGLSATPFYPIDSTIADWIVRNNVRPKLQPTRDCNHHVLPLQTSSPIRVRPSATVTPVQIRSPDVYDATNQLCSAADIHGRRCGVLRQRIAMCQLRISMRALICGISQSIAFGMTLCQVVY